MKKVILISTILFLLQGCHPDCTGSRTCIGPPDGTFQEDRINLAFFQSLAEEIGNINQTIATLDSIIIQIEDEEIVVEEFYHWIALPEGTEPTRVEFFYEDMSMEISQSDFVFIEKESFSNGGFLSTIVKVGENFFLRIEKVDQDFVDGICNDTITC